MSSDALRALDKLRTQTQQFLDQQRLTVNKITSVETQTTPMTVLAYQYYGSTDKQADLVDLNMTRDVSFVSGETRILTA